MESTKPNQPAFPVENFAFTNPNGDGLTKREYFAGLALQGMLSNPKYITAATSAGRLVDITASEALAKSAVEAADVLIFALNESEAK